MGWHDSPSSMLKESLPEYLEAARFCLFKSHDSNLFTIEQSKNCIGYPCALLLFSIVDSIGSYFKKNKDFNFTIDNKKYFNKSGGYENFFILNSKYFSFNLPLHFISALYTKFRSELSHNSILAKEAILYANNITIFEDKKISVKDTPFISVPWNNGKTIYLISLYEFFNSCEKAIFTFMQDIDQIVPNSINGRKFH